jgi:formate/nitrite transporter FocA (FNT family)
MFAFFAWALTTISLHAPDHLLLTPCRYVDIGLMVGAETAFSDFVWRNLVPVVIGNFIGGGVFMGLAQWLAYDANGLKRWSPKVKEEDSGALTLAVNSS